MVMGKKSKIKGVNIIFQFFWHLFAKSFAFPWEALHSLAKLLILEEKLYFSQCFCKRIQSFFVNAILL